MCRRSYRTAGPKGSESLYLSALVSAPNYHGMEDYTPSPIAVTP
jgi:hypothetical protein